MRIDRSRLNQLLRTYQQQKSQQTNKSTAPAQGRDAIELSEASKTYSQALQRLKELPVVRQAKVEDIKQRLAQGTYKVSAEDVAKKMRQHYTLDKEL